ncbi:MAG TPA: protein kinase [Vicinamibacterales bacterium]|nr:protein kinase [Vicinamibacterales bacterium]
MKNSVLFDVAAAVADGHVVDWELAEQMASSADERRVLSELRFIADLASGSQPVTSGPESPPPLSVSSDPDDGARQSSALHGAAPMQVWGPLRILEQVGAGSFGEVYRAWDSRLDREVALKILKRRRRGDVADSSTVVEEGRLLARVRHPNIVAVYGADRIDGEVGIWMEFVRGRTLEQELRERVFGVDEAVAVGVQLSSALTAVHEAGLLHRDVKAHNVMRDLDGRLILTDLGAGCDLGNMPDGPAPELAGTPLCLAPEVLGGGAATAQSDIYSLGVLLYHLVTGTYPVRGRSLKEIRDAHVRGARSSLREARPDLPNAFVHVVEAAIHPDPLQRYESAEALGAALRALTGTADVKEPAPLWGSWSRRRQAIVAGLLLGLTALAASALWPRSDPPVIAVLPFDNLGSEPNSGYFVDGLTDEIIRNLSQIDGLVVRSRHSSFAFRGKRNLAELGRELGVTHVLEGSVLWADGRLRINPQFVRVADDSPLWAEHFERDAADVFLVQDEISRAIVNELRLTLGRGQRRYNTNVDAYELYLMAQELLHPHDLPGARKAIPLFEQVIAKDSSFAPAYAALADAWGLLSMNAAGVPPREGYSRMRPAAERAIELDPRLAEAHAAMGLVLARDRDWKRSEAAFRRAIELNGSLTSIRENYAVWMLFAQGRTEDALRELDAALVSDPKSLDVRKHMAWVLVSAGRYSDAIATARRVLSDEPDHPHSKQQLARALLFQGRTDEAIAILESMGPGASGTLGYAYAASGRRKEALELAARSTEFPPRLAFIHAGLRDPDRTIEALERMADREDPRLGAYLTYPEVAFIRDDPRFAALRRRLGL